ncbi:MAG: hypothetical protein GY772_21835, partial [bacterium]|nr:hypothetical protein [bacterium]
MTEAELARAAEPGPVPAPAPRPPIDACVYGGAQATGPVHFAARDVRLLQPVPVASAPAAALPIKVPPQKARPFVPAQQPAPAPAQGPVGPVGPAAAEQPPRVQGHTGRPVPADLLRPVFSHGRVAAGYRLKVGDLPLDAEEPDIRRWLADSGVEGVVDVAVAARARSDARMAFITLADPANAARAA